MKNTGYRGELSWTRGPSGGTRKGLLRTFLPQTDWGGGLRKSSFNAGRVATRRVARVQNVGTPSLRLGNVLNPRDLCHSVRFLWTHSKTARDALRFNALHVSTSEILFSYEWES